MSKNAFNDRTDEKSLEGRLRAMDRQVKEVERERGGRVSAKEVFEQEGSKGERRRERSGERWERRRSRSREADRRGRDRNESSIRANKRGRDRERSRS